MKIRIKQNSTKGNRDLPDYTINYKGNNSLEVGREILSVLIGMSDVIMEIMSAQFPRGIDKDSYVESLVTFAKENSLEYSYRKAAASVDKNLFGQLLKLSKKNDCDHELLLLLKNTLWKKQSGEQFRSIIPILYYIPESGIDAEEFFGSMQKMMDNERKEKSRLVVFDWPEISQMGVFTKAITYDELLEQLKMFF